VGQTQKQLIVLAPGMTLIGLISDTHGLLRPQAAAALKGVSHILHAGDIGRPEILRQLANIAPVTAVRGNVDFEDWAMKLPEEITIAFESHQVLMLHNIGDLSGEPQAGGISAVVYGHSHKPSAETREGVLYINPGAAGPKRFSLPVSVGFLRLTEGDPPEAWIEQLDV
jgi:putative phosphoesterase